MIKRSITAFTLIEILITITIFSIVAVSLYSTFSSGVSAYRRSRDANVLCHEARFALNRMSRELRSAVFYSFGDQYSNATFFQGENDKISFYIDSSTGMKKVSYFLEAPEYGEIHRTIVNYQGSMPSRIVTQYEERQAQLVSLKRKEENFIDSVQAKEDELIQAKTLSALVKEEGLSFQYAFVQAAQAQQGQNQEQQGEEIVWQNSWSDNTKLPRGVRIALTLENPTESGIEEQTFTKTVFIPTGEIGSAQE